MNIFKSYKEGLIDLDDVLILLFRKMYKYMYFYPILFIASAVFDNIYGLVISLVIPFILMVSPGKKASEWRGTNLLAFLIILVYVIEYTIHKNILI